MCQCKLLPVLCALRRIMALGAAVPEWQPQLYRWTESQLQRTGSRRGASHRRGGGPIYFYLAPNRNQWPENPAPVRSLTSPRLFLCCPGGWVRSLPWCRLSCSIKSPAWRSPPPETSKTSVARSVHIFSRPRRRYFNFLCQLFFLSARVCLGGLNFKALRC